MKKWLGFALLAAVGPAATAQDRVLVHTDSNGIAVSGYDPVAFFREAEPIKGLVEHRMVYKGALYLFASEENLQAFIANPEKYEPRLGGYCPVSLNEEKLAGGDARQFRIVDGGLYLLHDAEAADSFQKEQLAFAERYWKKQRESEGLLYIPSTDPD